MAVLSNKDLFNTFIVQQLVTSVRRDYYRNRVLVSTRIGTENSYSK